MAVLPFGLNPVSSNARTTLEPETLRSQLRFAPVDIPNDISLAGAKRTGTIAPKKFQWVIAFHPIRPSDGEFLADHSHVFYAQLHEFGPVFCLSRILTWVCSADKQPRNCGALTLLPIKLRKGK